MTAVSSYVSVTLINDAALERLASRLRMYYQNVLAVTVVVLMSEKTEYKERGIEIQLLENPNFSVFFAVSVQGHALYLHQMHKPATVKNSDELISELDKLLLQAGYEHPPVLTAPTAAA